MEAGEGTEGTREEGREVYRCFSCPRSIGVVAIPNISSELVPGRSDYFARLTLDDDNDDDGERYKGSFRPRSLLKSTRARKMRIM